MFRCISSAGDATVISSSPTTGLTLGDNDDGDYAGVGVVVHNLIFTWKPLVRLFLLLGGLL